MRTKKQLNLTTMLKYTIVLCILIYIVLLFVFTGGSSKPFSEVEKSVMKELKTDTLQEVKSQGLKRYYGLNSADYKGVMLYISSNNMSSEEVLLIETKDSGQVHDVQRAINNRISSRRNDFDGYAPDQVKLINNSRESIRGNYIFLAISPDADKLATAFRKGL